MGTLDSDRSGSARTYLYRHEYNGVLVYDSHARLFSEEIQETTPIERLVSCQVKRDISSASEYDRLQFSRMKNYTCFKSKSCNYTLVTPQEETLRFDSSFEGGNLRKAVKVSEDEYNLVLEFDTETEGYTQWFYFCVENYKAPHNVRFNIVNLMKNDSLYTKGMKPLAKSLAAGGLWTRSGNCVAYYLNSYERPVSSSKSPRYYYTLTFTYTFEAPNDKVYFAHCYPYTYSDLYDFLSTLGNYSSIHRVNPLCKTLSGNTCPVISITQNIQTYNSWEEEHSLIQKSAAGRRLLRQKQVKQKAQIKLMERIKNKKILESDKTHENKKAVVVTARVHPGETNSSFVVQGLISFLMGESKEARALRKKFIFKIVPMLNPDGVVWGNNRASLLGVDLNRRWKNPNKYLHPTVFWTKRLISTLSEENEVVLYCDFHGHSIKKNAFMYGCFRKGEDVEDKRLNILIKLLPFMFQETNKSFSFKDSKFRLEKSKEATSRVVMFKELEIPNSFTLETSLFGPESLAALENRSQETGELKFPVHFEKQHLEKLGSDFCKILTLYANSKTFKKKLQHLSNVLFPKKKFTETREKSTGCEENSTDEEFGIANAISNIDEVELSQLIRGNDSDSGGSDSEGSDNDDRKQCFLKSRARRRAKTPVKKSIEPEIPEKKLTKSVQGRSSVKPTCVPTKQQKVHSLLKQPVNFLRLTYKISPPGLDSQVKPYYDIPTLEGPILPQVRVSATAGGFRTSPNVKKYQGESPIQTQSVKHCRRPSKNNQRIKTKKCIYPI